MKSLIQSYAISPDTVMRSRRRRRKRITRKGTKRRGGRVFFCGRSVSFGNPKTEEEAIKKKEWNIQKIQEKKDKHENRNKNGKPMNYGNVGPGMSMDDYCSKRVWYEPYGRSWVTSNGNCDHIPLQDLYDTVGFKQYVLGRMSVLRSLNYYNCQLKFRTLSIEDWDLLMNDLFIHCSWTERMKVDFPIRLVTYRPVPGLDHPGEPVILSQNDTVGGTVIRASGPRVGIHHEITSKAGLDILDVEVGCPTGSLFNREICQILRLGGQIWQCNTYPHTNLFFISFKPLDEFTVPIENGSVTLHDGDTPYHFTNVTKKHRISLESDGREIATRALRKFIQSRREKDRLPSPYQVSSNPLPPVPP